MAKPLNLYLFWKAQSEITVPSGQGQDLFIARAVNWYLNSNYCSFLQCHRSMALVKIISQNVKLESPWIFWWTALQLQDQKTTSCFVSPAKDEELQALLYLCVFLWVNRRITNLIKAFETNMPRNISVVISFVPALN